MDEAMMVEGQDAQRPPLSAGLEDNRLRHCSFCGCGEHEREYLIAADGPVYICERCVDVCRDVIGAERERKRAAEQHAVSSNAELCPLPTTEK